MGPVPTHILSVYVQNSYLVCLNLRVITGESYIKKVLLLPQLPEGNTDVGLEVVPLEAELLCGPHGGAAGGRTPCLPSVGLPLSEQLNWREDNFIEKFNYASFGK